MEDFEENNYMINQSMNPVVPNLVPVDLVPGNVLGLGYFPDIADEKVKLSKYDAEVIQFCQI